MARLFMPYVAFLTLSIAIPPVFAQKTRPAPAHDKQQSTEQEPPEEDDSQKPKDYTFNPLQAEKEMKVGAYYFKKGSYKAAARRFREATRWDPASAEAYRRLGQAEEKLKDDKAAHEAYARFVELAPDSKDAAEIRKKIERKP